MAQRERGIVLDVQPNQILVATPECEFLTLPARDPQPRLGEEIRFTRYRFSWNLVHELLPACAAAVLIIALAIAWAVSVTPYPLSKAVYYVALDINPSCELGINSQGSVVSVRSDTPDNPICDLSFRGMEIDEAVRAAFAGAARGGLLTEGQPSYVSVAFVGGRGVGTQWLPGPTRVHELVYQQLVRLGLDHTTVAVFRADYDARVAAHEAGLSISRYLALSKLEEWGLSSQDIENMTTGELIMALNSVPGAEQYRYGERRPSSAPEEIVVDPEIPATGPNDPDGTDTDDTEDPESAPDSEGTTPSDTEQESGTDAGSESDEPTVVQHVVWRTTGEPWPNLPADWSREELTGAGGEGGWGAEVSCRPTTIRHKAWVCVTVLVNVPVDVVPGDTLVYVMIDMPGGLEKASGWGQPDENGKIRFRFFVNPADREGRYIVNAFAGTQKAPLERDSCSFKVVR